MAAAVVCILLAFLGLTCADTNIARGGNVTQSSFYGDASPKRAIDGRRAGQWSQRSCTHTQFDNGPWWRLDLLNRYKIYTVTITNRADCCSERLDGAEIHIGDSLEDNGNANPRCAVVSRIAPGASKTFRCEGMEGQYINIVIPNRREYLTLCEVEVTGEPAGNTSQSGDFNRRKLPKRNFPYTNIARGGNVTQSSFYGDASPKRAIDGRRAGQWSQKSCTHTQFDNGPWWRLDLLNRYKIYTVTITNRGDCCSERLDGAEIHIGDSLEDNGNANPRCAVISRIAPGASKTFRCKGMKGQYINIVIPNRREYLTLCEVEVTGEPAGNTSQSGDFSCSKLPKANFPYTNIARGGNVTQSSLYGDASPKRAIDGRRAGQWSQRSCTHTQFNYGPWWRLDLLNKYKIYTVTITNRADCCSERLDGAEIHIGDSLEDNGNANPRCAVVSRIAPGASKTFRCEGMAGQYINIVIPNRREYLTLCEVEVTGEPAGNTSQSGDFNRSKLPKANFPHTNIARGGNVTQSSINGDASPKRAIDGRRAGQWSQRSCTHTQFDNGPWWRLDLLNRYKIYTVTITNREDCCSERLDGAEIHIGDSLKDNGNANPRCAVVSRIAPGASKTFRCEGMVGQYINIVIPNRREYLTLCEVEVTGEPAGNTSQSGDFNQRKLPKANFPCTNIARGGNATQSSFYGDASPTRAIDGRRAGQWSQKSCTHTQFDNGPWWRLDLLNRYKIYTVTITNRADCCNERLNGAEIHIGDSLEDNGNANPKCAVISRIAPGSFETFRCEGMEGQYINIVIPNRREYLTLCEVEVTGEPAGNISQSGDFNRSKLPKRNFQHNVARGGRVTQSSIYEDAAPERAIDGRRDNFWSQGSCTQTQLDKSPWWRLDLQKRYKIYTVTITNRADCCSERLNGAEIHIGDSLKNYGNANPRCAVISRIAPGASKTFRCEGMEGQYINIVIPNRRKYLTLCEVEVTGEPAGNTSLTDTNIARGGRVTQSSFYENTAPERAIDGRRDSLWSQGSCTHTENDYRPWWRLDLLKRYRINTVTITNRGDCCSERLNGAEIHIGDSLEDNGNANPRCAGVLRIAQGASETFKCDGMDGQYLNIVIPNRREYLTLCEVEVTGELISQSGAKLRAPPALHVNIARGGRVTQSSSFGNTAPERAIDGGRDSLWSQGSCTHTQNNYRPWWRLDLLKRYKINTVTITNRRDCCSERLNGAEIHIGDSLEDNGNANPRCAVITTILPGASNTFGCDGMEGQFLNIVIPDRQEFLTLCEVEVTGFEYDEGP